MAESVRGLGLFLRHGVYNYQNVQSYDNECLSHKLKLSNVGFAEIISSTWTGVLRGVFLANHLASTDS